MQGAWQLTSVAYLEKKNPHPKLTNQSTDRAFPWIALGLLEGMTYGCCLGLGLIRRTARVSCRPITAQTQRTLGSVVDAFWNMPIERPAFDARVYPTAIGYGGVSEGF